MATTRPEEPLSREAQCDLLEEHMKAVLWTTNQQRELTFITPSVEQLLGYTVDEAIGLSLVGLFNEESLTALDQVFDDELADNAAKSQSRTVELELKKKDGTPVWTETVISVLRNDKNQAIGFLGLAHDITARMEMDHMNKFMVGRELRMLELKEENQKLKDLLKENGIRFE